jgi:hypothetical protein
VYGNSFESSLVAVVNPNQQALERWAGNKMELLEVLLKYVKIQELKNMFL